MPGGIAVRAAPLAELIVKVQVTGAGELGQSPEGTGYFEVRARYAKDVMIEQRVFGRTGHMSSRTVFGAAALGAVSQDDADRTLEVLLTYGVNHIDVAASYGDAELRIGPWMDLQRARFFLATKTGERSYERAREELHRSLDRLRVEQIDLWQLHNLVDPIEWDQALSPGGALDAAIEAREQGRVRFIGITGHGSSIAAMHRRSLARFDFDSVLLPYSFIMMQDGHYAATFEDLMSLCIERKVAVQTIKSIARRPWQGRTRNRSVWYQPMEEPREIEQAVHWVLNRPEIFLNTAGDIGLLPLILEAADTFERAPSEEAMLAQLQRLELEPLFV
jgi:aryl-alcohol dehydrogenase-like predicted oxidoreductase